LLNGVVPGRSLPSLGIFYTFSARAESLNHGGFLHYPSHFGYPFGAPVAFGLPANYIQALWQKIPGINTADAYASMCCCFLLGSYFGCYKLLKSFQIQTPLCIIGTTTFLCSPFIIGHGGYAALMLAFSLLPTSILIDRRLLEIFSDPHSSHKQLVGWAIIFATSRIFFIFLDGYTFMISNIFIGSHLLIGCTALARRKNWLSIFRYSICIITGICLAYAAYTTYMPSAKSYHVASSGFLRAQGVDLATLIWPFNQPSLLTEIFKLGPSATGWQFYGDGSNAFNNYIGAGLLAAIFGLLAVRHIKQISPLLVAGSSCLILAMGPSIKFNSQRPVESQPATPSIKSYTMPASETLLNLHTEKIYKSIPGLKNMRSTYRWLLGAKVVILALGIIGIGHLYKKKHPLFATICLLLLVTDGITAPHNRLKIFENHYHNFERFDSEVVTPLRNSIKPGSLLLFVSTENDFLAGYIAAKLNCRTYNVGGDKNLIIAQQYWPGEVKTIREKRDLMESASALNNKGELDYLIFPHFNLRWSSYSWPPSQAQTNMLRINAVKIITSKPHNNEVIELEYATIIKFSK